MSSADPSEPLYLALESSGDSGGAAIFRSGELLAQVMISAPRAHGKELVLCVDRALREAQVDKNQLDLVLTNHGPGSYTGLRVGQSVAETIAFVLGIPALGVPALDVMCEEALSRGYISPDAHTLLPALDARRGEFVCARFSWRDELLARASEDRVIPPEALSELAQDGGVVFGDGVAAYGDAMPEGFRLLDQSLELTPASVGRCAWRLWEDEIRDHPSIPRKRVELAYFRPILALTVAERQAAAEAKRAK